MNQNLPEPGVMGSIVATHHYPIQENISRQYTRWVYAFYCTIVACLLTITGNTQTLVGLTSQGGASNNGAIIKLETASNTLTPAFNFDPTIGSTPWFTQFVQSMDGKLYGMTRDGGSSGNGVIFSFDPTTSTYTKLMDFDGTNGAHPTGSLMQAKDGKLYGTSMEGGSSGNGVIFSFDPTTNTYTKLYDFDGTNGGGPYGSLLIQATDGKLYGMAVNGGNSGVGVIFSFDPITNTYSKLMEFNNTNGATPNGDLIQAKDGKLYGMTAGGGNNSVGVIFSFDITTNTYTKLMDFDGYNGAYPFSSLMQATDGKLYGTTRWGGSNGAGVIFSFDITTSTYTKLMDFDGDNGFHPTGSLMQAADGKLYELTQQGGSSDNGVIISFDPATSTYTKLMDFDGTNGSNPLGSLLQATDGKLYGMTREGGSSNFGVIFSFNPANSTFTKLMDFGGTNGASPYGSLMQAKDGKLYGMSREGGSSNSGVIFSFDPASNTYMRLKDFDGINGAYPEGDLLQATDGKLYGMTSEGGSSDFGVIFSFDLASNTYMKLMDFDGLNGRFPQGSLMQATDGKLYGMSNKGGSSGGYGGHGVIFSFDLTTSTYSKLHDFDGTNGEHPIGVLLQATDGKLYGMAWSGGDGYNGYDGGYGVIFSLDPVTSTYTKLMEFDFTNGARPTGSLMQASNGKIYGMTNSGGTSDKGVIFSFDPATNNYTKRLDFDGTNGAIPQGSLMQATNGKLYGMTSSGGDNNIGVIFNFDPASNTYTKLQEFNGTNGANPIHGSLIELKGCTSPKVTASNNGPLCVGDTLHLKASEADTYRWDGPNNFTSTLQNPFIAHVTTAAAGTYTVTGYAGECKAMDSTIVVVQHNCSSCQNATNLTTTNITSTCAQLNWVADANPTLWQVEYKTTASDAKWIRVFVRRGARTVTITGLNANTDYKWRIRAICRKEWTDYSDAVCFKTKAEATTPFAKSTIEKELQLKVYPNPTSGLFTVELQIPDKTDTKAEIQLLDMTGRNVHAESAAIIKRWVQQSITLPSTLDNGVYVIEVLVNNKVYRAKLVYAH